MADDSNHENNENNIEYDELYEEKLRKKIRLVVCIDLVIYVLGLGYRITFAYFFAQEYRKVSEGKSQAGVASGIVAGVVLLFKLITLATFYWSTDKSNCYHKATACAAYSVGWSLFYLLIYIILGSALMGFSIFLKVERFGELRWIGISLVLYDLTFCIYLVVLAKQLEKLMEEKTDFLIQSLERRIARMPSYQLQHFRRAIGPEPVRPTAGQREASIKRELEKLYG